MTIAISDRIGCDYIQQVRAQLPHAIVDEEWQTADQATITVKPTSLVETASLIFHQLWGWLPLSFANDERSLNGHFAVYHVFSMEGDTKCWITVKVLVDADTQEYPSITPTIPAAVWGEREIRDMYGLRAIGLPDERRLVLPDDWPEDIHPLRKDAMDYRQRPMPTTDTERLASPRVIKAAPSTAGETTLTSGNCSSWSITLCHWSMPWARCSGICTVAASRASSGQSGAAPVGETRLLAASSSICAWPVSTRFTKLACKPVSNADIKIMTATPMAMPTTINKV